MVSNPVMPFRNQFARITVRACASLLLLFAIALIAIQVQQWLFRLKAERLLADFHALRLKQSTWADAQALMKRWGAWGHHDGTCTETSCKYYITLIDVGAGFIYYPEFDGKFTFILQPSIIRIYEYFGGRLGALQVAFIVQDGKIWRTFTTYDLHVASGHLFPKETDVDGDLVFHAESRQSLAPTVPPARWILGGSEQLGQHPNYKVGRPSGCESCLEADVNYSIQTPPDEVRWFTNYDFSCFTTKRCEILEDVLPAARKWNLYGPPWALAPDPSTPQAMPTDCRIPAWALGRDANTIISATAISNDWARRQNSWAIGRVGFEDALKGAVPYPPGSVVEAYLYPGEESDVLNGTAENIVAGHRYLLVLDRQMTTAEMPSLYLERCGALDDTPANRAELRKGFEMNDRLRVPEF
jgi:hypothetical protein